MLRPASKSVAPARHRPGWCAGPIRLLSLVSALGLGAAAAQDNIAPVSSTSRPSQTSVTALRPPVEAAYADLAVAAEALEPQNSLLRQLVRVCQPSVAHIEARKTQRGGSSPQASASRSSVIEEAGSGVVFRHRGRLFVITNYHVVDGAKLEDIRLTIDDNFVRATDIRHDAESDLSVMLIEDSTGVTPALLGDSSTVGIGEHVVVIGSPFGLSHSVSQGIVSARNRRDLELGPQGVIYQDFFQTDASINPGNSGGPLLNLRGEVIGINTAIASNSGGSDGIGFAIPINMVLRVVTDLIDHGYVRRGWLGVSLDSQFTREVAMSLGLRRRGGARLTAVSPGSPAAAAGLQAGDVVLDFGGTPVGSDSHLVTLVSLARIGDSVPLTCWRNGQSLTMHIAIRQKEKSER